MSGVDLLIRSVIRDSAGAHCSKRLFEWSVSAMMIGCGTLLIFSPGSIQGSAFSIMLEIGIRQWALGPLFLICGTIRAVALWHNGSWPRVGPHMRAFGAMMGAVLWFQLFVALVGYGFKTGIWPVGLPVYFVLMCAEAISVLRAATDVKPTRRPGI